ncbi:MAG: hypothetical protein ACKVX7_06185 [Planctomycetota bacterium]
MNLTFRLRQLGALVACALFAYMLSAATTPASARIVVARAAGFGGMPPVPTLEQPSGGSGPAIFIIDPLDDCVVELELFEDDFPPPVRNVEIDFCTGVAPLSPTDERATGTSVVSQHLAAVNGYLTRGVGRAMSDCAGQVSSSDSTSDGIAVELTSNNGNSTVVVRSSPNASIAAFSSGIAYGMQEVWFRCESSSTDVYVYESARVEASFSAAPAISTGLSFSSPSGGSGTTTSRASVVADGLRTADLSHDSVKTFDIETSTFERTEVSAGQVNTVTAQGNAYGPPFQSVGMGFIKKFRPKTTSSIFCDASNFIIVTW